MTLRKYGKLISLEEDIYQLIKDSIEKPTEDQTAQEFYDKIDQKTIAQDIVGKVQEHAEYVLQDVANEITG